MASTEEQVPDLDDLQPDRRRVLDFRHIVGVLDDGSIPRDAKGRPLVLTKKQARRRMMRKAKNSTKSKIRGYADLDATQALEMGFKPMEEWDEEELARGRPRAVDGSFRGASPKWVTRAMHEKAIETFKEQVKSKMRVNAVEAAQYLGDVLANHDTDANGKPIISASTKVDAAKFLVEHVLGKPKQEINENVNVRLQGLLANVMVSSTTGSEEQPRPATQQQLAEMYRPTPLPPEALAALGSPDTIDADSWEDDEDDDADDAD